MTRPDLDAAEALRHCRHNLHPREAGAFDALITAYQTLRLRAEAREALAGEMAGRVREDCVLHDLDPVPLCPCAVEPTCPVARFRAAMKE